MFFLTKLLISIVLGPVGFFVLPHQGASYAIMQPGTARNPLVAVLLPLSAEQALQQAQAVNTIPADFVPYRNWGITVPDIDAKAAVVIGARSGKVFYERNFRTRLPVASLTKLATALAILDELGIDEEVMVSQRAVSTEGDFGGMVVGEALSVYDLLRAMLIASSNDAAVALAEHVQKSRGKNLVELMNAKAYALGLADTRFTSVTGLEDARNYSTAEDIARFLNTAMQQEILSEIMKTASTDIRSVDGRFVHRLTTSNKLLGRFDGVVAGKTGYTTGAGGSLGVLAKNSKADDDFLVVVLGSTNEETRFSSVELLITWVNEAYKW